MSSVQGLFSDVIFVSLQGGLLFVTGSREGLMQVAGRKHNSDDLIATALAVEPMKVVYRARIVIFSIRVLRDERVIIVAEQRPDIGEDECFQWMSRVLQAIDSIHQVGVYCLALCPANTLPKVIRILVLFDRSARDWSV